VIDFDSRVEIRQRSRRARTSCRPPSSRRPPALDIALQRNLHLAEELAKVKAAGDEDVRRQALVLFSDGEDTPADLVRRSAGAGQAERSGIFTIALRGADTQSKGFHEAEFVMRQLAQETGGRSFFPSKIDDLNGVYSEIADELASSTRSATPRKTRSAMARIAGSSSR